MTTQVIAAHHDCTSPRRRAPGWLLTHRPPITLAIALVGLLASIVPIGLAQIQAVSELSMLSTTISDLVAAPDGPWLFALGSISLAIGSAAVAVAAWTNRVPGRTAFVILVSLWCAGLVVGAIFPTDPVGVTQLSETAMVHRICGIVMFSSLPVAGFVIARATHRNRQWARHSATIRSTSIASGILAILFLIANLPELLPHSIFARIPEQFSVTGLAERAMFASLAALLIATTIAIGRVRADHGQLVPA